MQALVDTEPSPSAAEAGRSLGRVLHGPSVASSEKSTVGTGYSSEWSFRRVFV